MAGGLTPAIILTVSGQHQTSLHNPNRRINRKPRLNQPMPFQINLVKREVWFNTQRN